VGLADGRYYDKALVDKAEQELKRQYLTRGFYAAEVKTTITPVDANRVSILFAVAEGRREDPPDQLHRQQGVQHQHAADEMQLSTPNWFSWYTKNDLYSKKS
jgi:outer membrane protein insertion porin family